MDDLLQSTCEQLLRARREPRDGETPDGWVSRAVRIAWTAHVRHLDARGPIVDVGDNDLDSDGYTT